MIISHYTKARWAPIILRDLQLKVSSAHTLNDPFEVSPKVDPKFYQNAAPILFREADNTREAFRLYGAKWGYSDFRVFELDASNWIPRLVDNIPLNVAAAQENFAEKFSAYFRLFFASKTSDSILMWSHYGEHHTGVVVEFETHYRPFSELEPIEVQCRSEKADFNFLSKLGGSYEAAIRNVIQTKATEWAYEQEVRFQLPVTATPNDLINFDPNAVRTVLFGCRTTAETRAAVLKEVSAPHYRRVVVAEFKRSQDRFSLERREVRSGS